MRKIFLLSLSLLLIAGSLTACTPATSPASQSETTTLESVTATPAETSEAEPDVPDVLDVGEVLTLEILITRLVDPADESISLDTFDQHSIFWVFAPLGVEAFDYSYEDYIFSPLDLIGVSPDRKMALYSRLNDDDALNPEITLYAYDLEAESIQPVFSRIVSDLPYYPGYFQMDWAQDSSFAVLSDSMSAAPILYFNSTSQTVTDLPVTGSQCRISPDGTRIAYTDFTRDSKLYTYDFVTRKEQAIGDGIRGVSPIWHSDSRRLMFLEYTGDNPSGLEGGELQNLTQIDLLAPDLRETMMETTVYRDVSWLEEDRLVLIHSGWDDGYFTSILDLDTMNLLDLGEGIVYTGSYDADRVILAYELWGEDGDQYFLYNDQLEKVLTLPEPEIGIEDMVINRAPVWNDGKLFFAVSSLNEMDHYGLLYDTGTETASLVFDMTGFDLLERFEEGSRIVLLAGYDQPFADQQVVVIDLETLNP